MKILFVDHESERRRALLHGTEFADTAEATGAKEAAGRLAAGGFDAVVVADDLPADGCHAFLAAARAMVPAAPVIVIGQSGPGALPAAVAAMRAGAADYLSRAGLTPDSLRKSLRELALIGGPAPIRDSAARAGEARYRALAESSPMGIWHIDPAGQTVYVNPALCHMLEVESAAELLGHSYHRYFTEESRLRIALEQVKRTQGESSTYPAELVTSGGKQRQVMVWGAPVVEDGEVTGVIATFSDISEQQRMEAALHESERRYRYLVDHAADAMYIFERRLPGRFIEVNQQACDMLGYTRDQMLAMSVVDLVAGRSPEAIQERWEQLTPGRPLTVQVQHRHSNGSLVPVEVRLAGIDSGDGKYVLGLARDMTERKAAERALRDSEERYRRLIETAEEGIWVVDPGAITTFVNGKMAEMLGYETGEMVGRPLKEFLFDADWEATALRLQTRKNAAPDRRDVRHRRRDGSELWSSMSVSALFDDQGRHTGTLAMMTDISDRRRAEEALRESNRTLEALFAHSPLGILAVDGDMIIQRANPAAAHIAGLSERELIGKRLRQVLAGDVEQQQGDWDSVLAGQVLSGVEVTRRRADGSTVRLRLHAAGLRDASGKITGVAAVIADVSESERLKEQLLQSQKMEAVGRLSGAIAHDFGNMLAVITGYAEALLRHLPEGQPLRGHAEEIERAANRGALLIRQLLAFNRRKPDAVQHVRLGDVIAGVERMLSSVISERISLTARAEPDLPAVEADHAQLEQVLVNLALNARDAMPAGGTLVIDARSIDVKGEELSPLAPGRYVRLAVIDSGHGMDDQTRARAFEPFFTTKNGTGTGLGLSIVQGIVTERGGTVRVHSAPGEGTTFEVYLPAAGEKMTAKFE